MAKRGGCLGGKGEFLRGISGGECLSGKGVARLGLVGRFNRVQVKE